jgi:hypothetical protein
MSTNAIVPFDFSAPVTAVRAQRRPGSINTDILTSGAAFPVIHIKGKAFSVTKDGTRQLLTRVIDDERVPVSSLNLIVIRVNNKARVFYGKGYVEGESDGNKPMCFSHDGVAPDAASEAPQHTNCAACPNSQWGTRVSSDGQGGKGTACTVNNRMAVASPDDLSTVYLLRAPAGSRATFQEAVKLADSHGKDYNEVQMRVSFDQELSTPKLLFKPNAVLSDVTYAKVQELFHSQQVLDIIGTPTLRAAEEVVRQLPAPAKQAEPEVDETAVLGALALQATAPAKSAAKKVAAKPVQAKQAEPPAGLLSEIQSLLGSTDD